MFHWLVHVMFSISLILPPSRSCFSLSLPLSSLWFVLFHCLCVRACVCVDLLLPGVSRPVKLGKCRGDCHVISCHVMSSCHMMPFVAVCEDVIVCNMDACDVICFAAVCALISSRVLLLCCLVLLMSHLLSDLLLCSICSESYYPTTRIPMVLSCGHTFCAMDLTRLATQHENSRTPCPTCRYTNYIPTPATLLPRNYLALELLEQRDKECEMGADWGPYLICQQPSLPQ